MGKRDYRKREPKKPKKGAKGSARTEIFPTTAAVEVIKKGKKGREEE